ncbi:unnamed protein product (macronuclear) [Paramecium tetraurelia]|uniref:Uncharacterized protein n=1 Tax=Paramecium tetraurelia TaxID=5888 RepID=A0DCK7_PARTE|nr:uncharacterized protein GSPATT00015652001 [Paramecium tetraurelia]CAK80774.1 unnamed protein product [Paramecium tetraurelia]|eukprot:XP_001448171.1 hypothetical protein (macronuclear) [Paramecium tetraurelia strain d4-2]
MKFSVPLSHSPSNFSKQLIQQQKQLCLFKVRKQLQNLNDPFDSTEISRALRNLETQQQRKQLLDSIIKMRETKRTQEEQIKQEQLQRLWVKANQTNSKKLNTNYVYHRDLDDFESIKQSRYRFESERIENFYLRNEGKHHNFHRVSSLVCLTTDLEKKKRLVPLITRKDRKNFTIVN